MGGEDYNRSCWYLLHIFHRYGSLTLQAGYHVRIMDYLVFDVHRRAKSLQTQFHDFHSPHHSGTETPG